MNPSKKQILAEKWRQPQQLLQRTVGQFTSAHHDASVQCPYILPAFHKAARSQGEPEPGEKKKKQQYIQTQ